MKLSEGTKISHKAPAHLAIVNVSTGAAHSLYLMGLCVHTITLQSLRATLGLMVGFTKSLGFGSGQVPAIGTSDRTVSQPEEFPVPHISLCPPIPGNHTESSNNPTTVPFPEGRRAGVTVQNLFQIDIFHPAL